MAGQNVKDAEVPEPDPMLRANLQIAPVARRSWPYESFFYRGMAWVSLLVVLIGFAPSYFLRGHLEPAHPLNPLSPLVHVHGVVFSLWVLLFLAQTELIATCQVRWHRRLGLVGAFLAIAMFVIGVLTALQGVERASGPPTVAPLVW